MWQDWVNILTGLWLAASPWFLLTWTKETSGMVANCIATGFLIIGFALWAVFAKREKWQEWVVILLCLWLFIAPGTLRYSVPLITWDNVIVGFVVGTFALWSLSERGGIT